MLLAPRASVTFMSQTATPQSTKVTYAQFIVPSDVRAGDLLFAAVANATPALYTTSLNGWTFLQRNTSSGTDGSGDIGLATYYRFSDGTEAGTTVTVNFSASTVASANLGVCVRYALSSTPVNPNAQTISGSGSAGTTTSPTPPAVATPVAISDLIIRVFASCNHGTGTYSMTTPSGWTQRSLQASAPTNSTYYPVIMVCERLAATDTTAATTSAACTWVVGTHKFPLVLTNDVIEQNFSPVQMRSHW